MKNWTVDDVMTAAVVSVDQGASYRSVVDTLVEHRISAVPVVDAFLRVMGVVSEADLLRKIEYAGDEAPRMFEGRRRRQERGKAGARTAGDLMSTPAVTVLTGTTVPAAARKMDAEKVKRLPVVDDLGRLIGVVTRGDLLKVHLRPDDDIRRDIETGVLRGPLAGRAEGVTVTVTDGVVSLAGHVEQWSTADAAVRLTHQVAGVADISDQLSYEIDDRSALGTGIGFAAG
ncbi:CBS domain-containing protein [Paractinoplanes rhizophilus]|jgi:CBS domain-containing protein|uniref:CBS domain-containing protein n=1 Tax=Paractinoplanes rhizophilus TaxID=1416877 RepID=A0ABW2HX46_9ACTN|nr:CBS domain-containing protein [Actinoplanes sp.]